MTKKKRINNFNRTAMLILLIACVSFITEPAVAQRPLFSTSDLYRISDNSAVVDANSVLVRNRRGISMTIHTSELPPGAYSVWWVIHNYPEFCTERPCTLTDEANPLVQASVLNATGSVVGMRGTGNFGAALSVGSPTHGEVIFGPGLLNPLGADVLMVVRYHGPVIPGILTEQLTTFDGGCAINTCSDEQVALHLRL